jgi:hypothetical protein
LKNWWGSACARLGVRGYYLFLCDYKNSVLHPSFQK